MKLRTLKVKKVDKRIGNRPIGSRFSEDEKRATIWAKLGIVEDVSLDLVTKKAPKPIEGKKK